MSSSGATCTAQRTGLFYFSNISSIWPTFFWTLPASFSFWPLASRLGSFARPNSDQQRGALPAILQDHEGSRRGARELEPLSREVPGPAPRKIRSDGDVRSERWRRIS